VDAGRVSSTNAKSVLAMVFASGESPRAVIEREGLGQVSDAGAIGAEIDAVLAEFPSQVAEYRSGKIQLLGFLVGQVMKRTAGRADARLVNEELRRRLA
jgi:Asp-tRNA(Asn)/Glu-tRNA(Gln) amidotransferase B subunit